MSYLTKDKYGLTCFSDKAKNDYTSTPSDYRDSVLMDMLGEMTFGCGKTRWDSPILFTHLDSRKIIVSVQCPSAFDGWDGCPYTPQTPGKNFAFVHEQGYEIRIMDQINGFKTIVHQSYFPSSMLNAMHWFELPKNIRATWEAYKKSFS